VLWSKVYRRGKEVVLALADEELMGREFEEGEFVLRVDSFYRGELVDEEEAALLCRGATIINAVGERAVKTVINAGLATEGAVRKVAGVPHVQVILYFI